MSFAFETTLSTRSYAPWIAARKVEGYRIALGFLWLRTSGLALGRVRARVRAGGHDVPEDVVMRRYERGRRNLLDVYATVVDRWLVLDNSTDLGPTTVAFGGAEVETVVLDPQAWDQFRGGSIA